MRLQIDPNWAIDWDGQCLTLIHFTVITGEGKGAKKTKAENIGKMRENLLGYYGSNLKQVLMAYVTKSVLEGDGTVDVAGLLYKLDQIEDTIKKLNLSTEDMVETPAPADPPAVPATPLAALNL
ncbi:MAG: hypothetical protein WC869_00155 [Phycisphaerae bacterium]|jgi:hypothetical protein